ncbi:MAG: hypothetical protein HY238_10040 [Acidobacteria bacterium]|nr:hypothetical protein [Acidobacteriota bacterium]
MSPDAFERLEQALRSGGPEAGFEFLLRKFQEEKNYPRIFEARLMKKRRELGLPLIQVDSLEDLPADTRRAYEQAYLDAAREVGGLFLADGEIQRAWPYFRAIGETAPVAAAIEQLTPDQGTEPLLEIAFHERVHPRKGFELLLANHGICRAISYFEGYPVREGREQSRSLLVRTLHTELVESLKRTIVQREGPAPDTSSVSDLIAGRDWLFEDNCYYTDTSHVVSVLRFSIDSEDPQTLALAAEIADYGRRLAPMFHYKSDPPFENIYEDHAIYLRALLGQDVDMAIAHFRRKLAASDPAEVGAGPAQALVGLLARLKRYPEAIEVSLEHLRDADPSQLACPSALQLCQLAGDFTRLRKLAQERGDLLSFTAATLQE